MSMQRIDLMPADIRARAEAGQRIRRTIGFCLSVALLAAGATTWASIRAEQTGSDLVRLEAMARQSLELESQAITCAKAARDIETAVADYRKVAMPMPAILPSRRAASRRAIRSSNRARSRALPRTV